MLSRISNKIAIEPGQLWIYSNSKVGQDRRRMRSLEKISVDSEKMDSPIQYRINQQLVLLEEHSPVSQEP
jgi:hypothetical protein